jgi:hypothetical protein
MAVHLATQSYWRESIVFEKYSSCHGTLTLDEFTDVHYVLIVSAGVSRLKRIVTNMESAPFAHLQLQDEASRPRSIGTYHVAWHRDASEASSALT